METPDETSEAWKRAAADSLVASSSCLEIGLWQWHWHWHKPSGKTSTSRRYGNRSRSKYLPRRIVVPTGVELSSLAAARIHAIRLDWTLIEQERSLDRLDRTITVTDEHGDTLLVLSLKDALGVACLGRC